MRDDGSRKPDGSLAGLAVLLVDDHEDTRLMLRTFLEYEGAIVLEADTAERALAITRATPPAVVLTDVTLGSTAQDGVWLLDRCRALPELAQVTIVAITGHAPRRAELRGRGFDDVMIKPVDLGDIESVVRAAMAARGDGAGG